MDKGQKILILLFFLLLLIIIGELGYYYFNQPKQNIRPNTNNVLISPTVAVPQLSGKDYLLSLIPKAKNQTSGIDGIAKIKEIDPNKKCSVSSNCFELNNTDPNIWYGYVTEQTAALIPIYSPFVIHISIKTKNEISGFSLSGTTYKGEWWQGLKSIFFGIGSNGKLLHVEVRNGIRKEQWTLLDKTLSEPQTNFNILFDRQGKYMLITDQKYTPIDYIDFNELTDNQLNDGVFSDNKLYINPSVAPNSYLLLQELTISTL